MLWPMVSRPIHLGVWHAFGAHDQISLFPLFCRTIALLFVLGLPLWREDGSVVCSAICQWSESQRTHNRRSKLLYNWRSASQYVLVSSTLVGLATWYYFLSECCSLRAAALFLWGALFDEGTGLQFTVQSLNGPSRAEPVTILYCLIWDSLNLEGQVPAFISPRNRVAKLYPRALGWILRKIFF
jgi:hypothetical protein